MSLGLDCSLVARRYFLRIALPAIVITLAVTIAGAFMPSGNFLSSSPAQMPVDDGYIRRSELPPHLRVALKAHGDRLERPGRERLTLDGTITRAGSTESFPIRLVLESPDKMRFEERAGRGIIIFNGQRVIGQAGKEDLDLVETLVFDNADHFFLSQTRGATTRHLGSRFRLDDEQGADYKESYYDIFQIHDPSAISGRAQLKNYYFNSDTARLDQVRYRTPDDGSNVVITFAGWKSYNGQILPSIITRSEGGKEQFVLTFTSAAVGPRSDDTVFSTP